MPVEDADPNTAIKRIKSKLDALFAAQSKALQDAVYVGISHDEVKKRDERLEQIKKLLSELATLSEEK